MVLEEDLRGTGGRVLFNGRYIPAATVAVPADDHTLADGVGGGAGRVGGAGDAATMTELTLTLPAPADPSSPPVAGPDR